MILVFISGKFTKVYLSNFIKTYFPWSIQKTKPLSFFCFLLRKATIKQLEDALSAESSSTGAKVKELQEWQQEHHEVRGKKSQPEPKKYAKKCKVVGEKLF